MSDSETQPSPCGVQGHTLVDGMMCEQCAKHCVLETPRERAARAEVLSLPNPSEEAVQAAQGHVVAYDEAAPQGDRSQRVIMFGKWDTGRVWSLTFRARESQNYIIQAEGAQRVPDNAFKIPLLIQGMAQVVEHVCTVWEEFSTFDWSAVDYGRTGSGPNYDRWWIGLERVHRHHERVSARTRQRGRNTRGSYHYGSATKAQSYWRHTRTR